MNDEHVKFFGKYREVSPSSIVPEGFPREFLKRQKSGLSGNFREQGYPFDTEMWEGIGKIRFREHEYGGREMPPPALNTWWPYEQCSYLLDGLVRLGILLEDRECMETFEKNLKAFFSRIAPDGRLGLANYSLSSEWPFAVFFRAVKAYVESRSTDEWIKDALNKHYHAVSEEVFAGTPRGSANIEGMLAVAEWTDDPSLVRKALSVYGKFDLFCSGLDVCEELPFSRLLNDRRLSMHGVTLSEEIKLPVLLFLYIGNEKYLEAAENAMSVILENHEQIPGLPSSNEFGMGRDPLQGYETCLISDFTWALGFFFMATGKTEYADRIEKIIFNALPGSISKDFTLLQYLSSPNQVVSTPFSNHSLFLYGRAPLRQYRPDHFTQCCPGNVHRAMPNYVMRMWMTDQSGAPSAVLYGACIFKFMMNGKQITLEESTDYPFEDEIRFTVHVSEPVEFPVSFRIPGWCRNPSVTVDGKMPDAPPIRGGSMFRIRRTWKDGSVIILRLSPEIVIRSDRNWKWVERGPLVFSLPVAADVKKEKSGRFSALSLEPAGKWNFALDDDPRLELKRGNPPKKCYPLENPPVEISAEARRISSCDSLAQGRYTPEIPLFYSVGKTAERIRLIPYGCTMLRISAFPDAKERKQLPVLSARASGIYPYNHKLPLESQCFGPERLGDYEFWDSAVDVQVNQDGYYNLIAHYLKMENVMAYVAVRIYSDMECDGVIALGVSDGAVYWFNGKRLLALEPSLSAEMCAPFHVTRLPKWH